MNLPSEAEWFDSLPDVRELRDTAQNLVRIASEMFEAGDWIEDCEPFMVTYWGRIEELQNELNRSAKSFSHVGEE